MHTFHIKKGLIHPICGICSAQLERRSAYLLATGNADSQTAVTHKTTFQQF